VKAGDNHAGDHDQSPVAKPLASTALAAQSHHAGDNRPRGRQSPADRYSGSGHAVNAEVGMHTGSGARHREIVARFEKIARVNLETTTSVARLCRAAGVTPRTLARAFRAVHGITPVHYLHVLRLSEARQTLLARGARCSSVTEVATRFGFRELGRFAGEYREQFGESPSETLRRSCPDTTLQK
jgi:transcriptional regulator GlxA family with amidase domain